MSAAPAFSMIRGWHDATFPPTLPAPHICIGSNNSYLAVRVLEVGTLGSRGRYAWVQTTSGSQLEFRVTCWGQFSHLLRNTAAGDRLLVIGGKFVHGDARYNPGALEWHGTSLRDSTVLPWPDVPPAPQFPCSMVDFFCGFGGLHEGASALGVPIMMAVDHGRAVCDLYSQKWPQTDVRCTDVNDRSWLFDMCKLVLNGSTRILGATPPCPAFSVLVRTGQRPNGFSDERGLLTLATLDILLMGQFPAAVLEQVHGLVSSNQGRDLDRVLANAAQRGYSSAVYLCDGRRFVPQKRKRIVILLVRGDLCVSGYAELVNLFMLRPLTFPAPCLRWWGVPISHDLLDADERRDCFLNQDDIDLYGDPRWLRNGYVRDATSAKIAETLVHMLGQGRRLGRDLLCRGLVGQVFDDGLHGQRWPTRRELAALMGFPRDHSDHMGNVEARAHYGNAVVPAMMCLAIGTILQLLQWLQDFNCADLFNYDALLLDMGRRATLVMSTSGAVPGGGADGEIQDTRGHVGVPPAPPLAPIPELPVPMPVPPPTPTTTQ